MMKKSEINVNGLTPLLAKHALVILEQGLGAGQSVKDRYGCSHYKYFDQCGRIFGFLK